LTGITPVSEPCSLYTLRVGAHAFPSWPAFPSSEYYSCVRIPLRRRSPSFVLVGPTGRSRHSAGAYRASLVPDDSLFAYHARLPRRTLRNLAVSYAETVPSVLSSDTVESLLILIYAFSGLHTGSWLPSMVTTLRVPIASGCSSAILACESGVTSPCGL
jgi:hypothetical protein